MTSALERYTNTAIVLHWIMAILLIALFVIGLYMVDLPEGSEKRSYFFALHKSIGLTMALLALARLVWRFTHIPPSLPAALQTLERRLSTATHHLLYLAMFVQPLSGYLSSSFSGYETKLWGVPLPHWGWESPELNELFTEVHEISALILFVLVVVHIAGTIRHIYRGEHMILQRMVPAGLCRHMKCQTGESDRPPV